MARAIVAAVANKAGSFLMSDLLWLQSDAPPRDPQARGRSSRRGISPASPVPAVAVITVGVDPRGTPRMAAGRGPGRADGRPGPGRNQAGKGGGGGAAIRPEPGPTRRPGTSASSRPEA